MLDFVFDEDTFLDVVDEKFYGAWVDFVGRALEGLEGGLEGGGGGLE